ncbi:MAG: DUF11 domain-containing protein [Blastocatellales bacterium]
MKKLTLICTTLILAALALNGSPIRGLMGWLNAPVVTRAEISGKDGELTVTTPNTIINKYGVLAVDAPAGASMLTVTNPGGANGLDLSTLTAGDLIMVIQMAGASINITNSSNYGAVTNLNSAGRHEFVTVSSVEGNIIKINPPCGGLIFSYSAAAKTQIIRVPQYTSLTINNDGSLTAPAWDGKTGGVVVAHVQNNTIINGVIDVSGLGYRGGELSAAGGGGFRSDYVTTQQDFGAEKGESFAGYKMDYDLNGGGRYGRGAPANGGGGGTAHNSGGGGGGNGNNGKAWNGQGVMDSGAVGAAAWNLDPGYENNGNQLTDSAGGGRGGYSFGNNNGDALNHKPGDSIWGGDFRREVGGLGGRPAPQDTAGRIFFGGGGGAGAQNDDTGGAGGNGGGLIYIMANGVSGTGTLRSNGANGGATRGDSRDGAGGGGAGGTIVVNAKTLSGISAQANGGGGGNQIPPPALFANHSVGPGAGGGGGFIAYNGGSISTQVNPGANGISQSQAVSEFPANGATRGATGTVNTTITSIPFCSTTSDLAITKTNNASTIVPGAPTTYTIVVKNNGPHDVFGIPVTDPLPAVFTNITWTCSSSPGSSCLAASGSGNLNTRVNLLNGGTATFQLTATPDPSAPAGQVTNTATVAPPEGAVDTNLNNNTASDTDTLTPQADLSITKTDGVTTVTAGTPLTYTIVVRNNGPSTVNGATVTDPLSSKLGAASWTCAASAGGSCGAASGTGSISTTVNLMPNATATFTITTSVLSNATGSLVNTATVTSPGSVPDTATNNNSATDTNTINVSGDLSITKTNNAASVTPGSQITYTIVASNAGPSAIVGATVVDNLPASLTNTAWTCAATTGSSCGAANGSGSINTTVDLLNGGKATFTITATVSSTATGSLVNTASVMTPPSATDPTPNNNTATDTDPLQSSADLSITKTNGANTVTAGTQTTYTIVVTNNGPSAVTGASVSDVLPPQLANATWTCVASSGSSCGAASGNGAINTTVNLLPNGTATFALTATVISTATGSVTNAATVTPPTGVTDGNTNNNGANDTDSINTSADLSILKTANKTTVIRGAALTYTIEVTNNGPSAATGATVTDNAPAGLNNVTWACSATAGSSCGAANGSGNINTTVNLAVSGKATFTLTATVANDFTGDSLSNTAVVAPPAGTTDPTPNNQSSTTVVTVTPSADLAITKTASPNPVRATEEVTFTINVTNNGPSPASDVTVTDTLASGLTLVSATSTIGACNGTSTITCNIGSLGATAPNNVATITIKAKIAGTYPPGPLANTAVVASSTSDPNNGNNSGSTTVTVTSAPGSRFRPADIVVRTTGSDACIGSGNVMNVEVKLTNTGDGKQKDNPGSELIAALPTQFSGIAGSCSASKGSCQAGLTQVDWNGEINVGETVTITYQFRIRQGVQVGQRMCTDFKIHYDTNNDDLNDATTSAQSCVTANCAPAPCTGPDCPDLGPGLALPGLPSPTGSDQRPGSILIFPLYVSDAASANSQNTRINITNTDPVRPAYLHMFFIDGSNCAVADNFLCLTPQQTTSFLASDLDPGVAGYLIAVAVDENGCPINFNYLIGDEYIKFSSGHAANLGAEAVPAINVPSCPQSATTATIKFDGNEFSQLGRVVIADSLPSPADNNSTILVVNRIGGDLSGSAITIGSLFGLLYDDTENGFSFNANLGTCQLRTTLNQNFPRTAPRFPDVVPSGRSGWMKLWINTTNPEAALVGATINASSNTNGYRGGHNLHKLTLGSASLTIPIFPPSCQ